LSTWANDDAPKLAKARAALENGDRQELSALIWASRGTSMHENERR
jgi:hypothetical protein